jgi:hypothetical protein
MYVYNVILEGIFYKYGILLMIVTKDTPVIAYEYPVAIPNRHVLH